MTKGSCSKKKKSSPDKMPKVARSPPKGQEQPPQNAQATCQSGQNFEALLLAMESRLAAKIEKASEASKEAAHQAKLNSEGLELLESRVDANEGCLMAALQETEKRILSKVQAQVQDIVQGQVKEMVSEQLAAAGFDQDLSAGDLSLRKSAVQQKTTSGMCSYAGVTALNSALETRANKSGPSTGRISREDQRDARFWKARRSLRLWPVFGGDKEGLEDYLLNKLRLDRSFIDEELGHVELIRPREPRNKNKDEIIAVFETKQVRDAVKAAAPNLANFRDSAGMRLHVPDHLQRDFQTLMNLSFDLKKKHPSLKRNVKFDEEDGGLFMDLKQDETAEWKRVKPSQAAAANKGRRANGTKSLGEDELRSMLSGGEE